MTIPDDCVVLSFASYRARTRSGVSRVGTAVYSFRRAARGGYYSVTRETAEDILSRKIPGVTKSRAPFGFKHWFSIGYRVPGEPC